jgi:large subunit ribosomal protein L25
MSQDKIELTLDKRTAEGRAVRALRRQGIVPAVVHDHGKPSVMLQGDYQTVYKAYLQAGKHHPIDLKAGDKSYTAMIKTVEFEPKKHQVIHIVFGAVNAREKIEAEVPIHPKYAEGDDASPAERASLLVISNTDTIAVEAIASNMPDALYYDAGKLVNVGDHVTVADLEVPQGVEVKAEPETTIATVYEPSAIAAANDAAGGDAEPGDEQAVDSDVTPDNVDESAGQAGEIRPGGKKENEDKSQGHNPEKQ